LPFFFSGDCKFFILLFTFGCFFCFTFLTSAFFFERRFQFGKQFRLFDLQISHDGLQLVYFVCRQRDILFGHVFFWKIGGRTILCVWGSQRIVRQVKRFGVHARTADRQAPPSATHATRRGRHHHSSYF
jgi:hypothetical protein